MNDELYFGAVGLGFAGALLLLFAWMIGVNGVLGLISNYRAHPERYPDGAGLGRWMGWTLAVGGASFVACAAALGTGAIGERGIGPWVVATAGWLVAGSLAGLARYRRVPPKAPPASKARRR